MVESSTSLAARRASFAMAGTGFAMLTHLTEGERPRVISSLIIVSAVLAWLAAREVRRNDVLGWAMVVGHALLTITTVVVLLTVGMPGLRISGWTVPTVSTLAFAVAVLAAGLDANRRRSAPSRGAAGHLP